MTPTFSLEQLIMNIISVRVNEHKTIVYINIFVFNFFQPYKKYCQLCFDHKIVAKTNSLKQLFAKNFMLLATKNKNFANVIIFLVNSF